MSRKMRKTMDWKLVFDYVSREDYAKMDAQERRELRFKIEDDLTSKITNARLVLKHIFLDLRKKHNILARMNFSCCSGCATYDFSEILNDERDDYLGVVYWHKQDDVAFKETGKLDIRYSGYHDDNHDKYEDDEATSIAVGKKVCELLKSVKIPYEWNEDPTKTIKINIRNFEVTDDDIIST